MGLYVYNTMIVSSDFPNPFYFIFLISVLLPFQYYFSSYETGQSVGGGKTGEPKKKHLAHLIQWWESMTIVNSIPFHGVDRPS